MATLTKAHSRGRSDGKGSISGYVHLGGYPASVVSATTQRSTPSKVKMVIRRPLFYVPILLLSALVYAVVFQRPSSSSGRPFANHDFDFTVRLQTSWQHKVSQLGLSDGAKQSQKLYGAAARQERAQRPTAIRNEFECNPFGATGRLHVNEKEPTDNVWTPYDTHCKPSNYMTALYRSPNDSAPLIPMAPPLHTNSKERQFLPWLMNKTVLIHGDSIDRYHLKDFCDFVGGELSNIPPSHRASPAPYRSPKKQELGPDGQETASSLASRKARETLEKAWEKRPTEGHQLTSPWVCDVPEYGFTLINVFNWGLFGAEEFFGTERWYHPPATWVDRFQAITLPLLDGLAEAYKRPQIRHPDLVEINSGFWDLRKWTEEDFVANGFTTRPYPEDSHIPYTNLSPERELAWEQAARHAIKTVARAFKGERGTARGGPVIAWRTLHHPPRHNYAPFPRVFALDSLARKVVSDLQNSQAPPPYLAGPGGEEVAFDDEDLGLDERLRIDESGALMLGQEHHFRDLLHPKALPGSWIWADVMLYELKRAVLRIGRSR